jgi:type II secretory pathway pseudopilin PulG
VKRSAAGGFALIDLIFVCGVIGILAATAMPRMLTAKQAAGASSAIGAMRAINSAQLTYAFTCGLGFYAPDLTTLGTAPEGSRDAFIARSLGASDTVVQASYKIQMRATGVPGAPASCNGVAVGDGGQGFRAAADPLEPTNVRFSGRTPACRSTRMSRVCSTTFPKWGSRPPGHVLQ